MYTKSKITYYEVPQTSVFDYTILLFQLTAAEAQVVTTPRLTSTLGDGPTITINGIDYIHTVIASTFGGAVQTVTDVRDALINTINSATGNRESFVTASANSVSTIRLKADKAGVPFTLNTALQTSYVGANPPSMVTNELVANVSTNYTFSWSGPNGFSSSDLQIDNY